MAVSIIRTAILYLLTVGAIRCMGKRQLGELEPSELVITLLISDLATLCMQDLETPLISSVIPIVTLVVLEIAVSFLTLKVPFFNRVLSGRYSVLIDDGVIMQKEMKILFFILSGSFWPNWIETTAPEPMHRPNRIEVRKVIKV